MSQIEHLDDDEFAQSRKYKHHAASHPDIQCLYKQTRKFLCKRKKINMKACPILYRELEDKTVGVHSQTHFDVCHWWNVTLEPGEHRHQCKHTRDQKSHSTRNRVQAQPEAEPRKHHYQSRGRECLY